MASRSGDLLFMELSGKTTGWRAALAFPKVGMMAALVNAALGAASGYADAAAAQPVRIVAFGDSLTAGYNLPATDSFPAKLEKALKAEGYNVSVANAGVSGDTSAGGRARLDWAMADKPQIAIVELGANDGLRGLDPAQTFTNLDAIIGKMRQAGVKVLLAGMLAPPNLGREYGVEFNAVYARLKAKHDVVYYPFFLDGVATRADLNLGDGMHPNARGVEAIVERMLPFVKQLLPPPV